MIEELFFDTDCLSAFLWVNDTSILEQLYGGRIAIPDKVYGELSNPRVPHLKKRVDRLVEKGAAVIVDIGFATEEFYIYRQLTKPTKGFKAIGGGEAAAIALTLTHAGILASNNYRDIAFYINKYNLKHIDTGMIMKEALDKGLITEEQGNELWDKMLSYNRKLPNVSFSEYLKERDHRLL
ncbi:MAG: hypothetical protein HUJ57_03685 [Erysipelotrichaceae bacterium]|nr:hypothetical protein [Erysipelotrichaceae bacterium]